LQLADPPSEEFCLYGFRLFLNENKPDTVPNPSEEEKDDIIIIILTAIWLMPGGSVKKIGRTYKKWTYIARKQNIQFTKKQHISQNFTVQYKCNEQNTR
jgi:hypothetical protein